MFKLSISVLSKRSGFNSLSLRQIRTIANPKFNLQNKKQTFIMPKNSFKYVLPIKKFFRNNLKKVNEYNNLNRKNNVKLLHLLTFFNFLEIIQS